MLPRRLTWPTRHPRHVAHQVTNEVETMTPPQIIQRSNWRTLLPCYIRQVVTIGLHAFSSAKIIGQAFTWPGDAPDKSGATFHHSVNGPRQLELSITTSERQQLCATISKWCRTWDLNPQPSALEADASANWATPASGARSGGRTRITRILSPGCLPIASHGQNVDALNQWWAQGDSNPQKPDPKSGAFANFAMCPKRS